MRRIPALPKKHLSALTLSLLSLQLFASCGPAPSSLPSPQASGLNNGKNIASQPSAIPSSMPSAAPSSPPMTEPSFAPTTAPSAAPTAAATSAPSAAPVSDISSVDPSGSPAPIASSSGEALSSEPPISPTATPTAEPTAAPTQEPIKAGVLTAGNWSDREHWDFWLGLMGKTQWQEMTEFWQLYPLKRVAIQVLNGEMPVVDQVVQLQDSQGQVLSEAHSNMAGEVEFYPGFDGKTLPDSLKIVAPESGLEALSASFQDGQGQALKLNLAEAKAASNQVDLMLTIDTTGSMGDELEYLKLEIKNVLTRIQQNQSQLQLRMSTNFYRDVEDEYIVRPFAFSSDFNLVQSQLAAQNAAGGGDAPEEVNQALEDAINKHDWSANARARLLFLVLDAPPHRTETNLKHLQLVLANAQKKGIRLIPIASSGIDKQTEFLLRMSALITGGEYVFLTDDSGVGVAQGHIEPSIGAYQVQKLNDLMVNLVNKYTRIQSTKVQ